VDFGIEKWPWGKRRSRGLVVEDDDALEDVKHKRTKIAKEEKSGRGPGKSDGI
jgi:hypothetical protein